MTDFFGTVELSCSHWVIRCEPHVKARLKRVFPRVLQYASDAIQLSATAENTRELEWFLQRYPMKVSEPEKLAALAVEHRDREMRVAEMLAHRAPVAKSELAKPAREYQHFAKAVFDIKNGLLLGDMVGLGKTVTAILSMTETENLPAVVVCPIHLMTHWGGKIAEFAPWLKVHIIKKGTPYPLIKAKRSRSEDLFPDRLPDVIIINYHKLRGAGLKY